MKYPVSKTLTVLALLASTWPLKAQTTAPAPAKPAKEEEVVVLSPFEVSGTKDTGYQATETMAGTRIRTELRDVGSAIQVITKEFMKDIGATDSSTLLQYTTNAEVGGTRGTYAGLGNGSSVDETSLLRAPAGAQRVRGLVAADNTRDFFVTDIPWDSYNVDRIDIQRGPNQILFGLGSPAGIVNASLYNAEFRNKGNVENRVGSYGSVRTSVDLNQDVIHNVLAVRIDGLLNNQKYEQKQAYQDDKRLSLAVRFEPQLFKDRSFHTSIKAKYENGDIKANRPRITPPADSITPWFRPVTLDSNGIATLTSGAGKLAIDNGYQAGSSPQNLNPWFSNFGDRQQPTWFIDGTSNQTYRIYSGYINNGFVDNTGAYRGAGNSALGQRDSGQFYTIANLSTFATNAKVPGYQYGQFRQQSLQDPTVFDFYNKLIDGQTKSEFEKWNAYNLDVSQTAFDDRLGVQFSYDRQKYKRGGEALLGNPTIAVDILKTFQDANANTNFGRPYVSGGPGRGNSYESDRRYTRGSIFGELRARDFFKNDFLVKLLGRQRFNGVYSAEKYNTENRSWQMFANSQEWDAYWTQTNGASNSIGNRSPQAVIYLGPSLASAASAAGANISGINGPVTLQNGGVYSFNSTWTPPVGVTPGQAWVPSGIAFVDPLNPGSASANTQASNPANYVGWNSATQDNLLRYANGADPRLTTIAQKTQRVTKSYAGSWQGYLWNAAIVPTLGWRFDEVKSKAATAAPLTLSRGMLNLDPASYALPADYPTNQIFSNHSTAGGVVVHLNKLLGEKDPLPFNISLSYNKSSNFQVTDTRRDVYGKPISNPTGTTKEYGILLSTKDGKYSLRAMKYETSVQGGSTTLDTGDLIGSINQGIKFRNVFLYRMSGYTWDTREQTNLSPGQRFFWTPAYINSAGRPVADLNGAGGSTSGATLETQAQADAHRDASIRAWNDIQKKLDAEGFFSAWNFGAGPNTLSSLTDRATYEATLGPNTEPRSPTGTPVLVPVQNNAALVPNILSLASYLPTAPPGFTVTADTQSKGYEFEFTANPTKNLRLSFNASETVAIRTNVGGPVIDSLVAYLDTQMAGAAGDMRQFNGNYSAGGEVRTNYANFRSKYTLLKLQEGAAAAELRKWRYNIMGNYSFREGKLKGAGVGAAYRWQDKVVIGYPVLPGTGAIANFDLSKPYYGPSESGLDLWVSYERKISNKITWKIQANVRNVGKKDSLIPTSVEPDGKTWASVRVSPVQDWTVTNTFSF